MPDTYSIKPQIYNISHANTNVDFVTKKILLVTHYIYTSIPFISKIHTSRSCRISLESSSFIRLVPFDKAGYASA